MEALSYELEQIDGETQDAMEAVTVLDREIAKLELEAGVAQPRPAGKQHTPEDQLHQALRETVKRFGACLRASGVEESEAARRESEYAMELGVFQGKTMLILRGKDDEEVSDMSVGTPESDKEDAGREEPESKERRRKEPTTENDAPMPQQEEEMEEQPWTTVLGPRAKRAQKQHKMASTTMQEISKRLSQPSAGKAKGSGKAKGAAAVQGKGKGPAIPSPTDVRRPRSQWDVGAPPLLPGTQFPPAGGLQAPAMSSPTIPATQPPAPGQSSSSSAGQQAGGGQARPGVTMQYTEGQWKEILANRGGDGHLL
jgi:hypothetical protein